MGRSRVRGVGLRGICNYLRKAERSGLADEIIASLPAEHRPGSMGFLSASTYDLAVIDAILRGYHRELERTKRASETERAMRAIGASIAEDNLNTVFKLVLSLVKPNTFVEKLPSLWGLYFSDADASAKVTAEGTGVCVVRGIEVAFLAPIACSWIEFGLRHVGAKEPIRCSEEQWSAGVVATREAKFTVKWG
ncbi:MAG: hypothetical protein U0269_18610 [Polyangiales bacterium]